MSAAVLNNKSINFPVWVVKILHSQVSQGKARIWRSAFLHSCEYWSKGKKWEVILVVLFNTGGPVEILYVCIMVMWLKWLRKHSWRLQELRNEVAVEGALPLHAFCRYTRSHWSHSQRPAFWGGFLVLCATVLNPNRSSGAGDASLVQARSCFNIPNKAMC